MNERKPARRAGGSAAAPRPRAAALLVCLPLALACSSRASSEPVAAPAAPVAAPSAPLAAAPAPRSAWDLEGIIGSGQSLSVGAQASDVVSTAPRYPNLKLGLGSASVPPFDPAHPDLALVPLVEPIRPFPAVYPSAYPHNIYGETPHFAMASQISSLARAATGRDVVSVHTVVGENGQGMSVIDATAVEKVDGAKSTGRSFAAALFEVAAITRLARAQGKTYGVGGIILTHGETDAGNAGYESDLFRFWSDYNRGIKAITGQAEDAVLFITQQHSFGFSKGVRTGAAASTLAAWRASAAHPGRIVCVGPKYQYPHAPDTIHFGTRGYRLLGEKYGQAYFQHVVQGQPWRPLEPAGVSVAGNVVSVRFHVPVPPLTWDESLPPPHQPAPSTPASAAPAEAAPWSAGRGFELRYGESPIPIESVTIAGDTVHITSTRGLPPGATVGYAATSDGTTLPNASRRRGQLRDSDPFVGAATGEAQPNHAVAFELPLP